MKVAKLEIKMIVAMLVMGYEYDVVNSKGGIVEKLPVLDHNERQTVSMMISTGCLNVYADFLITTRDQRAIPASLSSSVLSNNS